MNKSLLNLVNEFQELDRLLIESNGELSDELELALSLNQSQLQTKVDKYKLYLEHLKSRSEYFKSIEEEAKQAKKIFENANEAIKERLKFIMINLNVDELSGESYRFKLIDGKDKLVIHDETLISDEYKKEVVSLELDKEKLMKDLQAGLKIDGVDIQVVKSLRTYIKK